MPVQMPLVLPGDISETAFGKYVQHAADDRGWQWCHVKPLPVPKRAGRGVKWITPASTGFPDYVMLHPGWPRLLVLELKATEGTFTPAQKRWLRLFDRLECVDAWYARPENWPAIINYLDGPARLAAQSVTTARQTSAHDLSSATDTDPERPT